MVKGHAWQRGACMAKGGMHVEGECVVKGACVVGGGHALQRGRVCMAGRGMCGRRDGHCGGRYVLEWILVEGKVSRRKKNSTDICCFSFPDPRV